MRRWLQWRVSRALQQWLDSVTFLSEQQRLAKKATKSWKAGGVSHGWRRWRDATEPRTAAPPAAPSSAACRSAARGSGGTMRSRHSHGLAALKLAASAWCERKDMLMKWQARSSSTAPAPPPRSSRPLTSFTHSPPRAQALHQLRAAAAARADTTASMRGVVRSLRQRGLRKAYTTWHGHVSERAESFRILRLVVRRWQMIQVSRALNHMVYYHHPRRPPLGRHQATQVVRRRRVQYVQGVLGGGERDARARRGRCRA